MFSRSRLLIRHESTLARLKEEVQTAQGDDTQVTKAKLQKMPYLKNVLLECRACGDHACEPNPVVLTRAL